MLKFGLDVRDVYMFSCVLSDTQGENRSCGRPVLGETRPGVGQYNPHLTPGKVSETTHHMVGVFSMSFCDVALLGDNSVLGSLRFPRNQNQM